MTKKKILDLKLKTEQRNFTIVYDDFLESDILDKNEKLVFIALKRYTNKTSLINFIYRRKTYEKGNN